MTDDITSMLLARIDELEARLGATERDLAEVPDVKRRRADLARAARRLELGRVEHLPTDERNAALVAMTSADRREFFALAGNPVMIIADGPEEHRATWRGELGTSAHQISLDVELAARAGTMPRMAWLAARADVGWERGAMPVGDADVRALGRVGLGERVGLQFGVTMWQPFEFRAGAASRHLVRADAIEVLREVDPALATALDDGRVRVELSSDDENRTFFADELRSGRSRRLA